MYSMWKVLGRCAVSPSDLAAAVTNAGLGNKEFHQYIRSLGDPAYKRLSVWEAGDLRRILLDPERKEYLDDPITGATVFQNAAALSNNPDWLSIIGLCMVDTPFRTGLIPKWGETEAEYKVRVDGALRDAGLTLPEDARIRLGTLLGDPKAISAMATFNYNEWVYPDCDPKVSPLEEEVLHPHPMWQRLLADAVRRVGTDPTELRGVEKKPDPGISVKVQ